MCFNDQPSQISIITASNDEELIKKIEDFSINKVILNVSYSSCFNAGDGNCYSKAMVIYYYDGE